MRDLGTPVFPRAFFENVLELFSGATWICVVAGRGAPVAAALLLAHRDVLEIPWASSLRAQRRSAPNMLLYWTAIQFAAERGYKRIDFGRSTRETGTYDFKRQWGAVPTPQYWYYWLPRPGQLPELDPHNPKYRMAISVWKRLPVRVATALGPFLVRYIP
jgi:FemAB-related protein (PEP-CTERM system-associated)